ncbi:MAG: hypothetical protein QGH94_21375, partial [Phycisphaerae bacterium]|nr:hypothetical protein [Phycisphaerae bacterium]
MKVRILTVGMLMMLLAFGPAGTGAARSVSVKMLQDKDYTVPSVSMKMKLIPAGSFTMGSAKTEPNRPADETQHKVTITKTFN